MQLTFDAEVEVSARNSSAFSPNICRREAQAAERPSSTCTCPNVAALHDSVRPGWLLPGNPPDRGRNANILQQFVHREELSRRRTITASSPRRRHYRGIAAVVRTDEQKQRWQCDSARRI